MVGAPDRQTRRVEVPLVPFQHQYVRLRTGEPVSTDLPTLRDPDDLVYFRPKDGDLVTGGYGRDPAPWSIEGIPENFGRELLSPTGPVRAAIRGVSATRPGSSGGGSGRVQSTP